MNPYQYQTVEGDFKLRKVSTGAGSQKYGPCEYCNKSADSIYSFNLDQECKWITDDPVFVALRKGNLNFVRSRGSLFAHSDCGDEWAERTKAILESAGRPDQQLNAVELILGRRGPKSED